MLRYDDADSNRRLASFDMKNISAAIYAGEHVNGIKRMGEIKAESNEVMAGAVSELVGKFTEFNELHPAMCFSILYLVEQMLELYDLKVLYAEIAKMEGGTV